VNPAPFVLDIFLDIFGNVLIDLFLVIFLVVGIIVGFLFRPKGRKEVCKFDLNSKRFMDFDVTEESAVSLECEPQKGMPPQRFYKNHAGFTGVVGRFIKRPAVRFLGRMGTAFTWKLNSEKVDLVGGLDEALKLVWGKDFYNTVPEEQRIAVEKSEIGVTVNLDEASAEIVDAEGKPIKLTEEDIKIEQDRVAAKTWWEGIKAGERKDIILLLLAVAAGAGLSTIAFVLLGKL